MDRGAWWATVHRIVESDMTDGLTPLHCKADSQPLDHQKSPFVTFEHFPLDLGPVNYVAKCDNNAHWDRTWIPVLGDLVLLRVQVWFLIQLVSVLQNHSLPLHLNAFYLLNMCQVGFTRVTNNSLILPPKKLHLKKNMLSWSLCPRGRQLWQEVIAKHTRPGVSVLGFEVGAVCFWLTPLNCSAFHNFSPLSTSETTGSLKHKHFSQQFSWQSHESFLSRKE